MNLERGPQVELRGKLLPFPRSLRSSGSALSRRERTSEVAATERRLQRLDEWSVRVWWLLAWIVAACRLHLASARHEMFGAEATLAFLVAVVLPLARVRKVGVALGQLMQWSRRATTASPRGELDTPTVQKSVGDDHAG